MNLIIGAIAWLIIGFVIGFPIVDFVLGNILIMSANVVITLGLVTLGFFYSLHKTAVGFRGVPLYFGKRWIPFWESEGGFNEGWNSTILPYPLADVQDVDCREQNTDIKQMTAYTKDNIRIMVEASMQTQVVRPLEWLSAENPKMALEQLALRSIRAGVEDYKAFEDTPATAGEPVLPGIIREDKMQLSKNIEAEVMKDFPPPPNQVKWGMRVLFIRISHIELPKELEAALRTEAQEVVEGRYEQTQAGRRRAQVKELVEAGVNADTAYAGSLVDAGKSGAEVKNFTVRGLENIGPLVDSLGNLGRGIQAITRGKTTQKGREK